MSMKDDIIQTGTVGILEYGDKAYAVVKLTSENEKLPAEQKTALERAVIDLGANKHAIAIVVSQEDRAVLKFYTSFERRWRRPGERTEFNKILDYFYQSVDAKYFDNQAF